MEGTVPAGGSEKPEPFLSHGGGPMETLEQEEEQGREGGYLRCLSKAMARTRQLLREEDAAPDYGSIHSVKSVLYAAIEQAGMESERMISAQALLRELLTLVALQVDPVQHERAEAFKILEKLKRGEISNLKSQI
jgi:hypothetical protein